MNHRAVAIFCVVGILAGCGGATPQPDAGTDAGSDAGVDGGTDAGATNRAPLPSFTSAETIAVGQPLVVDATASSDPDGDPLRFSWDFGDGIRGGTATLAHVFATAGTFPLELTVTDAAGRSATLQRTVTVTAGPQATAQAELELRVLGPADAPVEGATVSLLGTAVTATSDAEGWASLQVGTGIPQTLRVEKPGYSRQTYVENLPATATEGRVEVALRPLPEPLILEDAAAGGTLEGASGVRLILPPSALVDGDGVRVTGAVQVQLAPVDVVSDPRAFPGAWRGVGPQGELGSIVSFGATDFVFTQNGQRLDLAPDRTAVVELPVFPALGTEGQPLAVGDTLPLWSLDEQSGLWVMEGQGTLVASASSPTGLVQRAEVSHFSWWNCDDFTQTHTVNVDCCLDEDGDGTCDLQVACFLAGSTCGSADCANEAGAEAPPQSGVSTTAPAGQPVPLRMPTAFPVKLQASGPQALSTGSAVVAPAAPDTVSSLTVVLTPAEAPDPTNLITLPFDQTYPSGALGVPVRFEFDAAAGQRVWAAVERAADSTLSGQLRLLGPGDVELASARLGFASGSFVHLVSGAGRYALEFTPEQPAQGGAYRLQARDVGTAMTVVSTDPAPDAVVATPPGSVTITFSAPVKVSSATTTSVKLYGPSGELVRATTGGLVVSGSTVTWTPRDPLGNGLPYRLRLTTALQDTSSNPLVGVYELTFRTEDVVGGFGQLTPTGGDRSLAMATDGTAMLVYRNASDQLLSSRYLPGEGWSMPERVAPLFTGRSFKPMVSAAGAGLALVTWVTSANGSAPYTYHSAHFDPATGWSAPLEIPLDPTDNLQTLSRTQALDAQGRAVAVWKQSNNGPHGWFSRYLPASGWSAPARFDNDLPYGENGMMALNQDGEGALIYRSVYDQYFTRFDPVTGTFGTPVLQGNGQGSAWGIAAAPNGDVFTLRGGTPVTVYKHLADGSTRLEREVPGSNSSNCAARLAITPGGQVAVAFCKAGPSPYVDVWSGADWAVWEDSLQLTSTTGLTYLALGAAGEDLFALYELPNSAVPPTLRRRLDGVWDAEDTVPAGVSSLYGTVFLEGSPAGPMLWLSATGSFQRLQ